MSNNHKIEDTFKIIDAEKLKTVVNGKERSKYDKEEKKATEKLKKEEQIEREINVRID